MYYFSVHDVVLLENVITYCKNLILQTWAVFNNASKTTLVLKMKRQSSKCLFRIYL